jgi:hypothetical protein
MTSLYEYGRILVLVELYRYTKALARFALERATYPVFASPFNLEGC